jgi:anthranilate/para-aminobenzoate synthase component II
LYYLQLLDVPVYGICFGAQLLNIIYGGTLVDNKKYICEAIPFYKYDTKFPLIKDIDTNLYNYCFSDIIIPSKKIDINILASIKINNKKYNVLFEFEKNKVYGSLFHPEINLDTQKVFYNFYNICKKYS